MSDFLYERRACDLDWRGAALFFQEQVVENGIKLDPPRKCALVRQRGGRVWRVLGDLECALLEVYRAIPVLGRAQASERDRAVLALLRVSEEVVYSNGP